MKQTRRTVNHLRSHDLTGKCLSLFVIVLLSTSTLVALNLIKHAEADTSINSTTVNVTANPVWTDTDLQLKPGEVVSITASGTWAWGPDMVCGPNGNGDNQDPDSFLWASHASLIAYVGSDPYQGHFGDPTFFPQSTGYWEIGSNGGFTAPVSGELWLGFNDAATWGISAETDNYGSVTAVITFPTNQTITFTSAGLGSDASSATVLTIDGTSYPASALPVTFTWLSGTVHPVNASSIVNINPTSERYLLSSWTNGNGLTGVSGNFTTPDNNVVVTANYNLQYLQTFSSSPTTGLGLVMVDGVDVVTPYTSWWNSGSSHSLYAYPTVNIGSGTNQSTYLFSSWSDGGSFSHSVSPTSATNYTASYLLTGGPPYVYLNVSSAYGDAKGSSWYVTGQTATFSVTSPYIQGGVEYVCTGWTGGPSNMSVVQGKIFDVSGSGSSGTVAMYYSMTINFTWQAVKYAVSFEANPSAGGVITSPGSSYEWYDIGASGIQIEASANFGYYFSGWSAPTAISIDDPSSDSTTITVYGSGTVTANFNAIPSTTLTVKCVPESITQNTTFAWGSYGSDDGQFNSPNGIAVSNNGTVYVADTNNNRVEVFDSSGNYLTQWGFYGSDAGEFSNPKGIAVDQAGNVYVADSGNDRVEVFDANGNFLTQWYGSDTGQFDGPTGIAVDSSGHVYVADTNNNRVEVFDSDGNCIMQWGSDGSDVGQFSSPSAVAVDNLGHVYVVDANNNRVEEFDSNGNFLNQWGSYGSSNGQFSSPSGIAVDGAGDVYVADYNNYRIEVFSGDGTYLGQWGTYGSTTTIFENYPSGIAVDSSGNVYVVGNDNRVVKYDAGYVSSNLASGSSSSDVSAVSDLTSSSSGLSVKPDMYRGPSTGGTGVCILAVGNLTCEGSGVGDETVYLSYYDGSSWQSIGQSTTGSDGSYSFVWAVPISLTPGFYQVQATFNGDGNLYLPSQAQTTDVVGGGGLFILPEYLFGGLAALAAAVMAFVVYRKTGNGQLAEAPLF